MAYCWPKMFSDAFDYAKRCHACQVHEDFIQKALGHLHTTKAAWSFEMRGMDVIGPISQLSPKGHRLILTITYYFSKWAEALPFREV